MKPQKSFIQLLFLGIFIVGIFGCTKDDDNPDPPITHERGDIISSTIVETYSPADIQQILDASGTQLPLDLIYTVDIISVEYYTVDKDGNEIITSGAFMLPQGLDNLSILSSQHGTESKRDLVASVSALNSTEGLVGLISTSGGYFTLVADYPGFGVSEIPHPYMHAESLVPCVIDFIRAGKSYCSQNEISLNGNLFLTGYSEGGFVTLAAQKEIEENYADEFEITAVAPMAGPYNFKGMIDTIFQTSTFVTPSYIAYFLTAYDEIYSWNRLDDFFTSTYASEVGHMFDGSSTWGEIINQMPVTFSELIDPVFQQSYTNGSEVDLSNAIEENTILDWTPIAPIHFFHGDADQTVPYYNVATAIEKLSSNGGENIFLTTIPGGTHATAGPIASVAAIQWFNTF